MWLRRVDGLSQKEVASKLGITAKTVEKHVARGVRLLADSLFGGGSRETAQDGVSDSDIGSEHG